MTSIERRELRYQRRKTRRAEKKRQAVKNFDDFCKVFTYDNLYRSYLLCRKGVRWKSSTQKYIANATMNVYDAYRRLHDGTFRSRGFYEFDICERGKNRHIRSVDIHERIVQRCLSDYSLTPMLSRSFIHDNGACLHGKGYAFSMRRFSRHLQRHIRLHGNAGYVLLFDFSGYFDSIPHELLFGILENAYQDKRIVDLVKHFIMMFGCKGLGLGSQVSQILALAAANKLDHYIKEELRIKGYGRYMDDGYIIHESKDYLSKCLQQIQLKCTELGLTLNAKKTRIVQISHSFTWLKVRYRVTTSGHIVKRICKKSVVRMRRKLKRLKRRLTFGEVSLQDIVQSYQSWRSHSAGLHAYRTLRRMDDLFRHLFVVDPHDWRDGAIQGG